MQGSPEKVSISGAPMETAPEMSIVEYFEKDPTEKVRMEEAVDNSEKDLTKMIETRGFSEMATPAGHFLASTAHAGPSDAMPRAPSIRDQSTVEYLRNLLLPVEKLFLNEQRGEK